MQSRILAQVGAAVRTFLLPSALLLAAAHPAMAQRVQLPAELIEGEPVTLTVSDATPGAEVTLTVERASGEGSSIRRYHSSATFVADAAGLVDVARAMPVAGSYHGADPAGLFWSMSPVRETSPALGPNRVRVSASVAGGPPTSAEAALRPADPRVVVTDVDTFPGAQLYRLPGNGRRPVVIILHGSEGGTAMGRSIGPALAARGHAALSVPYYSPDWGRGREVPQLPADFANIPVDRLDDVRDWIARQPGLDAGRIGLYGVSKGGEFAIIAASKFPWLKAVAAIVPSDVVWEGWGPGVRTDDTQSSFAWKGRPLAYVPYIGMREAQKALGRGKTRRLRAAHDDGRAAQPQRVAAATIPIERFSGALLVAGGDQDGTWASGSMARAIGARRARAGLKTTVLTWELAGHGLHGTGWDPINIPGYDVPTAVTATAQRAVRAATFAMFDRVLKP